MIRVEDQIREKVKQLGYSISIGNALKNEDKGLNEVIKESDVQMYEDKTKYYLEKGIERRRN